MQRFFKGITLSRVASGSPNLNGRCLHHVTDLDPQPCRFTPVGQTFPRRTVRHQRRMRGLDAPETGIPAQVIRKTAPGFMMPNGSSAVLIARIAASFAGSP